ncbi:uracil-DNA glycosylase [Gluconacetobacter sp. 1b LMG 1731]|uniref:Type-4 uracil-DNA glycosylase n=1 Tax=Gluconacetobacter dulcium TaxID=2729096 RepID=A0A7W4NTM4_9PROT|nr:uracil-DNA glycosylase [Gluconacetobacter dulcium]MBB2165672.1 uracil-DNA glycosylase [Gluconacetobacter dulcium]MBB2194744.1 uracil-DNA glycosylase [Gluconacetobacter dulcium]
MMDALALLRLYAEWGADTALDDTPIDWLARPAPAAPPPAAPSPSRPYDAAPRHPAARAQPGAATPAPATPEPRRAPPRPAAAGEDGVPLIDRAVQQATEAAAAAHTLAALHAAMAGFTACSLRDTATHTVATLGEAPGRLLLIGEPPDAAEDRSGTPFAGPMGDLLDRMLASIGLARADMLLAPVIPWRPPGERPPSATELRICAPFLHRLIVLAAPRKIIAMGNMPARLLTGDTTGIARLRGRWRDITIPGQAAPIALLPMRHPSQIGASPTARRDAWKDLLLLRTTLDHDKVTD